ncbi:unnamed protein product [Caenorhabditis sp. 36 PRJEB53466]|nr:unnamed protein product [Caenorhabditis sp. 36 PRJEB53466]
MTKENDKKPKEKPNQRKVAFRNEAVDALANISDESLVNFAKAMEVAKLDCQKCRLHETTHNPKASRHQNCRDNPFCINRLGLEKFEKLINQELENREEAKKDQKRRDLNDQPAGLVNGGNFCYVNSFLQVWFNVPEFRQIVYDFRPSVSFTPLPAPRLDVQATMLALQDIFYTLQTTPFTDTDKTSNLVKLLRLNSEQQDSQEFGLKFFNALERCLPDHPNGKVILTRLKDMFNGDMCTRIQCKCGHSSRRVEPAISLTLNIEGHSTLIDALNAYFGEEHLDDYKCSGCQKTGDVTKQVDYVKLPPVIVIQLNRYKYTAKGRQKLKTQLAYPREIPALAFQRVDQSNRPPAEMYDLFAVTIHEGSNAECGHYYDLIKSPLNQKWYRYNDETVEALAKPPGTDKPTSARGDKSRRKEKEKTPTDQKACYGLLYRRRDAVLPLPHPKLPPDELVAESKKLIEEQFEGQTKRKIEKSEKRVYDLRRRIEKLKTVYTKLETHSDKYTQANEIAFLPTSLLLDILSQEYEAAKGEKKKKKKESLDKENDTKTQEQTEDEALAAAIAASEADQLQLLSCQPSTSAAAQTEVVAMETGDEPDADTSETCETPNQEAAADISMESVVDQDQPIDSPPKDIDIVAIAMEESELPVVEAPPEKRTRQQNGTAKYVFSRSSPRKSTSGANGGTPKPTLSTRVASALSSHEMAICGHGKMSIDPILYGDVKAVARAPAIALLREYDFRVKKVFDNGDREFPEPQRDREVFVFTAADICMECIREMRQEGLFNNQLEDDDRMVRKVLKEEKQRCSVKGLEPKSSDHFYVAKSALANFKKSAQTAREEKLALRHTRKGTMYIDSVSAQKADATYPAAISLKRFRGRPRKHPLEVPEKMQKLDENGLIEATNESFTVEDEEERVEPESPRKVTPTKPVESINPDALKPTEKIEFNSELRCSHGGVNYSQFRHSVSPEEWAHLKIYFDDCFEVKCSEPVCDECRQQEVDAQNGSDNMRQLVKEMRKRINDTLKKVESRSEKSTETEDGEEVKFGICSVFIDKLKKLTTRQSTSPPPICQECLICQHELPFKGFLTEDNQKDSHVIGVTEEEWNTFLNEVRKLELAGGESQATLPAPRPIIIDNGRIVEMCDVCYEQHIKFTEEQKYMFDNENIYVKLVNLADEEDIAKTNGKSRRGRAKNVYAVKMSSSNKLMDLKVQLYDKTHQLPNDQMLYRTLGGEHFDVANNQKTLFDLRVAPNNNDNPLILVAQQFSPSGSQNEESGDRAPERGFVDTALAH